MLNKVASIYRGYKSCGVWFQRTYKEHAPQHLRAETKAWFIFMMFLALININCDFFLTIRIWKRCQQHCSPCRVKFRKHLFSLNRHLKMSWWRHINPTTVCLFLFTIIHKSTSIPQLIVFIFTSSVYYSGISDVPELWSLFKSSQQMCH